MALQLMVLAAGHGGACCRPHGTSGLSLQARACYCRAPEACNTYREPDCGRQSPL